MAISGTWKAARSGNRPYANVLKQGTGVNRIHAVPGGPGRNTAPNPTEPISPAFTEDYPEYGYCEEDQSSALYGYGVQTGTQTRPSYDPSNQLSRGSVQTVGNVPFPSPGRTRTGIPRGTALRSVNIGADISTHSKEDYPVSALAGAENKIHDAEPLTSDTSDPGQYEMQTSMQQLRKTRSGSQRSGSLSPYDSPVATRTPGPARYVPSGDYRHVEMQPKEQSQIRRPFFIRRAGYGPAQYRPNPGGGYQSEPLTRVPPDEPYAGPPVSSPGDTFVPQPHEYGYTSEDVVW